MADARLFITIEATYDPELAVNGGDYDGEVVTPAFIKQYLDGAHTEGGVPLVPGVYVSSVVVATQ